MEPNELNNAIKVAESQGEVMQVLSSRINAVLELYRVAVTSFLQDPRAFDPTFNANVMSMKPRYAQEKYYKRVSESLLIGAQQAMMAGDGFFNKQHIVAALKLAPEQRGIPGVDVASLMAPGPWALDSICSCGHAYGAHLDADKGPCTHFDCKCKHFTLKPDTPEKG